MAAPTLPADVIGPASGNLTTSGRDVRWIEISTGGALKQCACAPRYLLDALASALGLSRPTGFTDEILSALKTRTGRNFSTTLLTRDALRVAIWYVFSSRAPDGVSPAGLADERIWLPNSLTLPTRPGQVIPAAGSPGVECHAPQRRASATTGGSSSSGGGGSSTGGSSSSGGGSTSGGSSSSSSRPPVEASMLTPVTVGAMVLVGVALVGVAVYQERRGDTRATAPKSSPSIPAKGRTTAAGKGPRSLAEIRNMLRGTR